MDIAFRPTPSRAASQPVRHYEVDWLRVIATGLVFLYHSARFFDNGGWHVKNYPPDFGMTALAAALDQVIMPLFFILSGISTYYALQAAKGHFLRERVRRLLVPLAIGILVLGPPQIYLERLSHGQFSGSLIAWLPSYFDGFYGFGGNFAWMGVHTWYLLILFLFSLISLPLFRYLRGQSGRPIAERLAGFLCRPGMVFLPIVPLVLAESLAMFDPHGLGMEDFGGWNLFVYLLLFLYGYGFLADERLRNAIAEQRRFMLCLAIALMLGTLMTYYLRDLAADRTPYSVVLVVARAANVWVWLLAFLGMGTARLQFTNRPLRYLNEMVLPFYVLHQPVILLIGFNAVRWDLPVLAKYLLIMALALPTVLLLYEFVVRRFGPIRFLFGLKAKKAALPVGQGVPKAPKTLSA
ncbi:MAG: acyltransferase family protein [Chloroflexota bacterium]